MSRKSNNTPVLEQVEAALAEANTLTIKQAVAISGLSEVYIRKALKAGKLVATKVPVSDGSKNLRNEITVESFNAWRASAGTHSKREDGRNKFVLYMSEDEAKSLIEQISGMPFAETLTRANIKTAPVAEA